MSNETPDLNDILELAKVAEELLNGKEYFVGTVVERLSVAAEQNPHDQAIRLMAKDMEKRFEKNGSLSTVTQREIQDVYDQVSGLGSMELFQQELGDLLLTNRSVKVANYNENYVAGLRDSGEELDLIDNDTVAEYQTLFGEPSTKLANRTFVENGRKGIELELLSMGFANPTVEIADGNSEFVVYAAEVTTSKGRIPFLVPAEVKLGSALLPSTFVSGNEFLDFTKENVLAHAAKDIKRIATPNAVLNTLAKLKGGDAVKTATASNDSNWGNDVSFETPGLYSELVDEPQQESLDYLQAEMPEALKGLSEDFVRETLIESGLSFDRDVVLQAKAMLSNELSSMGFATDKIKISSEFPEGIVLATNISGHGSKKSIEVPVEIKNDRVLMPSTFTSGAVVKAFDEKSLKAFANSKEEGSFNAFFSDKNDMRFDELYNKALQSAAFGNFLDVEECLAVIESKFGPDFHRTAFNDLMGLVRVGFNTNTEEPLNEIDAYIKEAADELRHKEANISMSNKLLYLYSEDD